MLAARATILILGILAWGAPASAADYAGGPAVVDDSLWLGHFSGGRNLAPGAEPIPLDWLDVKQDFASLRDCSAWLRDLTRAYTTYEGFKTCVRIR